MATDESTKGTEHIEAYNMRLGLVLFALYLLFYGGFVALVTIDYRRTAVELTAGLNLAIVYGIGLIAGAFVLALVYMVLARNPAPRP